MIAADFPLLDIFFSILWFFVLVIWFFAVAAVVVDIFRSPDMSGWARAAWFALVLFLPLLGLVAYLVARGAQMERHEFDALDEQDARTRAYVTDLTSGSTLDEINKLADLRERGALSDDEFQKQKAVLLR